MKILVLLLLLPVLAVSMPFHGFEIFRCQKFGFNCLSSNTFVFCKRPSQLIIIKQFDRQRCPNGYLCQENFWHPCKPDHNINDDGTSSSKMSTVTEPFRTTPVASLSNNSTKDEVDRSTFHSKTTTPKNTNGGGTTIGIIVEVTKITTESDRKDDDENEILLTTPKFVTTTVKNINIRPTETDVDSGSIKDTAAENTNKEDGTTAEVITDGVIETTIQTKDDKKDDDENEIPVATPEFLTTTEENINGNPTEADVDSDSTEDTAEENNNEDDNPTEDEAGPSTSYIETTTQQNINDDDGITIEVTVEDVIETTTEGNEKDDDDNEIPLSTLKFVTTTEENINDYPTETDTDLDTTENNLEEISREDENIHTTTDNTDNDVIVNEPLYTSTSEPKITSQPDDDTTIILTTNVMSNDEEIVSDFDIYVKEIPDRRVSEKEDKFLPNILPVPKRKPTETPQCSGQDFLSGPTCDQYYECETFFFFWYTPVLKSCPEDHSFSVAKSTCVPTAESDCID